MVKVLWTGGWDSTFRMIQLARSGREVQPYYVIDSGRKSSLKEIKQMQAIKNCLIVQYPESKIHEINFIELSSIAVGEGIPEAHERLKKQRFMGDQYVWIAALANNIDDLELCIHSDDKAEFFNQDIAMGADQELIFGNLNFPILAYTKLDMEKEAKKNGELDILNMSWFCFDPIDDTPCGICNPCLYSLQEGMGRRFSLRAKVYSRMPRVVRGARRILRKVI